MTQIFCNIFQSGSNLPLVGYVNVTANAYLTDATKFYTATPLKYPLVNGTVTIELIPTDISQTSYKFEIYAQGNVDDPDILLNSFDAVVPFSATPINLNTLAPQIGIRYDRRDASLLTLARFLTSNSAFTEFFARKLWRRRGQWDSATTYREGDVVLRQGSSYQHYSGSQTAGQPPEAHPETWQLLAQAGQPLALGMMSLFPTNAALPPGYLRCNGAAVSRVTYSSLFAVVGTTYGTGDGSTTFNLPNLANIVTAGYIIYAGV